MHRDILYKFYPRYYLLVLCPIPPKNCYISQFLSLLLYSTPIKKNIAFYANFFMRKMLCSFLGIHLILYYRSTILIKEFIIMKKILSLLLSTLLCLCPLLSNMDSSTPSSENLITKEIISAEISPMSSTLPGGGSDI